MISFTHKMQALPYRKSRKHNGAQNSDMLLPFSALQAQQAGKDPAIPSLQEAMSLDPTYFASELYTARQRSVSMNASVSKVHTATTGACCLWLYCYDNPAHCNRAHDNHALQLSWKAGFVHGPVERSRPPVPLKMQTLVQTVRCAAGCCGRAGGLSRA